MDWQGIAALVSSLGVIVLGVAVPVVNARQSRKDKRFESELRNQERSTEIKIKHIEQESTERRRRDGARLNQSISMLYGYLWKLMFDTGADRISVIQPHPLEDRKYISVSFEVLYPDRGIASLRDFRNRRISEWAHFVSRIGNEDWLVYLRAEEIKDTRLYSEVRRRGTKTVIFRRMTDGRDNWTGSLCAEYISRNLDAPELSYVKGLIEHTSVLIQDILPEYIGAE